MAVKLPKAADDASHKKERRKASLSRPLLLVLGFKNSLSDVRVGKWEVFQDEYMFLVILTRV